jgi:hypothetical protein
VEDPLSWFEEAVEHGKYRLDIINEIKSCVSEAEFDYNRFMIWVSKQIEKE